MEVCSAAGFDDRHIAIHDVVFGAGEADDLLAARAVVVMRVADEKDFDVAEVEAERFDALPDQRHRGFETRIDENEPARRGDEVGAKVLAADVVEVSRDAEGRKRSEPCRIVLGGQREESGSEEREEREASSELSGLH